MLLPDELPPPFRLSVPLCSWITPVLVSAASIAVSPAAGIHHQAAGVGDGGGGAGRGDGGVGGDVEQGAGGVGQGGGLRGGGGIAGAELDVAGRPVQPAGVGERVASVERDGAADRAGEQQLRGAAAGHHAAVERGDAVGGQRAADPAMVPPVWVNAPWSAASCAPRMRLPAATPRLSAKVIGVAADRSSTLPSTTVLATA